jgi:hypothetical protein
MVRRYTHRADVGLIEVMAKKESDGLSLIKLSLDLKS